MRGCRIPFVFFVVYLDSRTTTTTTTTTTATTTTTLMTPTTDGVPFEWVCDALKPNLQRGLKMHNCLL
jgi:hypothetical protein